MSVFDELIENVTPAPPIMLIHGDAGVGKTFMARDAGAILIDCEGGAGNVPGLRRTPYLETWPEMRNWIIKLIQEPKPIKAVAIDTIDWMVRRIVEHVVIDLEPKSAGNLLNSVGQSHGGYFSARGSIANFVSRELFPMLNALNSKGTAIILLAHSSNTTMKSPEGYDTKTAAPDLPEYLLPMFQEWAGAILYAHGNYPEGRLQTVKTNVITAKNRYGMPPEIPMTWASIEQYVYPAAPEPAPIPAQVNEAA